jgi:hypothetical protein
VLLNDGREFHDSFNVLFLYGVVPINGVIFRTDQSMVSWKG